MPEKEVLPKLRALTLHEIVAKRRKVLDALLRFVGQDITGPELDEITDLVTEILQPQVEHHEETLGVLSPDIRLAVRRTLECFVGGQFLDQGLMRMLAAVIAGNTDYLRVGRAVSRWVGQAAPEWVLLQIREGSRYFTKTRKVGGLLTLEVLCGSPAGHRFKQFVPQFVVNKLAVDMGVRHRKSERTVHPRELVRMMVYGKLEEGIALRVAAFNACAKAAVAKRNRELARHRGPVRACLRGYRWACHYCPVGYANCSLGTHEKDYVLRDCTGTPPHTGWFDVDSPERRCLQCVARYERAHL